MKNKLNQVQSALIFHPHPLIRNRHLQTIAPKMYRNKGTALRQAAREMILDTGEEVRLQGYYSPQAEGPSKGVVLLLHGWLGSANSNYVVAIGEHLYRRGYSIFRLNLRDHGNTHHLNPDIFRSDRLDEVFVATQRIAQLESDRPLHIIGHSLGGNFALRLAWRHSQTPLPNLGHTITFCPVLDPYHTTLSMDNGSFVYLAYFRRKWRRGLRKKQAAFPARYDFSAEIAAPTCLAMTETFVRRYSPYPDARAYFDTYTITPEMLANTQTPITIVTAADDPVVPVSDFHAFCGLTPNLQVHIQPHGGHVGFIDIFPFRLWVCEATHTILENRNVKSTGPLSFTPHAV
jgi:predicted alpha/beta-fold hydrolase